MRFWMLSPVLLFACAPPAEPPSATEAAPAAITRSNFLEPANIPQSLQGMDRIFPTRTVPRSEPRYELLPQTEPFEITYEIDGATRGLEDLMAATDATGLLVLQGDQILHEGYGLGAGPETLLMSMSVGKSFTSTLVGLARADGKIASFDEPVTRYLPELAGTGYDGVAIRHVLEMSSGLDFNETYEWGDESDAYRLLRAAIEQKETFADVARSFGRKAEPGSKFEYVSNDTQILGMLLARVTGTTLSDYMAERLWGPLGAESDARWILDREGEEGVEMAFGGFNSTLRDYGRFGLLMAYEGKWRGAQLLPEGWVEEATVPHSPQVDYGKLYPDYPLGYGYQWWCFPGPDHAFTAQGIHGQFVMVNPVLDLVVVKTSAWPVPWDDAKERETYAFFHEVEERLRTR
jgi:CubicO group peptidase (beta-lactamase class C family)